MRLSARAQFTLALLLEFFANAEGLYRIWRLMFEWRDDGELRVLWSDGRQPECFSTIFRMWACRHTRTLTVHRKDGTCGEQCLDCSMLLNYRLNAEEAWLSNRYWENQKRASIG